MKKEYHYFFNINHDKCKEILELLNLNNIKYTSIGDCISLRIYEDNLHFAQICKLLKHKSVSLQIRCEYSKKELSEAKFLRIWLRRYSGYPQPEAIDVKNSYINYTFDIKNFCIKCGSGLVQNDSFYLKKSFNIDKIRFGGVYWVYDTFFITTELRDLFAKEKFTGIEFVPVKNIKTKQIVDNIVQLKINEIFPAKLKYDIEKIIDCKQCGQKRDVMKMDSEVITSKDVLKDLDKDFYLSQEFHGDGFLCCKSVLISNRVYKFLIDNKIKNICAEPIRFE
ncbi:MAG: hypothetical protein K6E69_03045 [Treponema sp.]|uniref:hypothetical protein n=1 Tax=Treponema sp. TaxID=166 RepID=UPI00298EA6FA|nr:hypothetical protein [Treponema sp.]MCR5386075.1 hypothetical protein [Treponema sp.]